MPNFTPYGVKLVPVAKLTPKGSILGHFDPPRGQNGVEIGSGGGQNDLRRVQIETHGRN